MSYYIRYGKNNENKMQLSDTDIYTLASTGKIKRLDPKTNEEKEYVILDKPKNGETYRNSLLKYLWVTPDEVEGSSMLTATLPQSGKEDVNSQLIKVDDDWLKSFYGRTLNNVDYQTQVEDYHVIPTLSDMATELGRTGAKLITKNPFENDMKAAQRDYRYTGDERHKKRYDDLKKMSDEWENDLNTMEAPEWGDSMGGQIGKKLENIGNKVDVVDLATAAVPFGATGKLAALGAERLGPGAVKTVSRAGKVLNKPFEKAGDLKFNPLSGLATRDVATQGAIEGVHGWANTDVDSGEFGPTNALENALIAGLTTGGFHGLFGDVGRIASTPDNIKIRNKMNDMTGQNAPADKYGRRRTVTDVTGEGMNFDPIGRRGQSALTEDEASALIEAEMEKMRIPGAEQVYFTPKQLDEAVEEVNTAMIDLYKDMPGVPRKNIHQFEAKDPAVNSGMEGVVPPTWTETVNERLPYPSPYGYRLSDISAVPEKPPMLYGRVPGSTGEIDLGTEADFYILPMLFDRYPSRFGVMKAGVQGPVQSERYIDDVLGDTRYLPDEMRTGLQNIRDINELSKMKYSPALPERRPLGKAFPRLGDISERRLTGEFGASAFVDQLGFDLIRELIESKLDKEEGGKK